MVLRLCFMRNVILTFFIVFSLSCNHANSNTSVFSKRTPIVLSNEVSSMMLSLKSQTILTTSYNAAYVMLDFPNGDVAINTGVCADVIIRALRSNKIDLQKEVHEDMSKHFKLYPNRWNLKSTDKNIDHRRVANLMKYFERKQKSFAITDNINDYKAGDIVAWKLDNGLLHIGMVYDETSEDGTPLIIHNIGSGAKVANVLFQWKIIGHYRWFE